MGMEDDTMMSTKSNSDTILFEIQSSEYLYWETFCDEFIEKCTRIIESKQGTKKIIQHFQEFKECLERILFIVDISKQDPKCTIQIPTAFLALFQSVMQKWQEKLQYEIQQTQIKLSNTTNGENKRQLFEKQHQLETVAATNLRMIQQMKRYQEG
jgi:hypothetical protein